MMHFCITKGFCYRLNIVWWGEGVYTPIGDTKKGKESANLKMVLVFQLLLAGIVDVDVDVDVDV